MNPSSKENATIPLPPAPELPPLTPRSAGAAEQLPSAERALVPPAAPSTATPAPATALPLLPQLQAVPPTSAPTTSGAVPGAGLVADDGDLIEKEWVAKAKQIVERTRDDPYKQSENLTLFKADYMQKRYGKTIKVSR